MGLRINTNVASVNAQRSLRLTRQALDKSLERLSSGSRINRAGDDAAGLAISEGLKAQIRGMKQVGSPKFQISQFASANLQCRRLPILSGQASANF
jgi:hypothetical protein